MLAPLALGPGGAWVRTALTSAVTQLCLEARMPTVHVQLFKGRTTDQKRAASAAITEAVVATLGGNAATVQVIFHDIERHDWATGGVLWSDQPPAPPAPAAP